MCIRPHGAFELLSAAMVVDWQRGHLQPDILVHLMPTDGHGFLEILVQASVVKGVYWAKKISLGWRLRKCEASEESVAEQHAC